MRYDKFDIIAPTLLGGEFNEAELFGSTVWLWMHSASHRNALLHMLSALLLPAIKTRQFVLASENGKPVFYLSWARLNKEAEKRYLQNSPNACRRPTGPAVIAPGFSIGLPRLGLRLR